MASESLAEDSEYTLVNVTSKVAGRGWLITRKARSLVLLAIRRAASIFRIISIKLCNEYISIPWSTVVAKGVDIQITDGGSLLVGRSVTLGTNILIQARSGHICIGDATFVGHGCTIVARDSVRIGMRVLVAEYVTIRDQDHRVDATGPLVDAGFDCAPIEIDDDVWIGAKASVFRGAHIGIGAVIGAHALVKGHIPAYAIAVGVPARVKRFRRGAHAQ